LDALAFGLIAALAWGIHDICVRYVGRNFDIYQSLFAVLVFGGLLMLPVTLIVSPDLKLDNRTLALCAASGLFFCIGTVGIYNAFAIGPVRLVAPVVGSYPVLYVGWAWVTGNPITAEQLLAVFAVLGGVALVAMQPGADRSQSYPLAKVIAWASFGAIGLALTFAIGHMASVHEHALPVINLTRFAAISFAALTLVVVHARRREQKFLPNLRQLPLLLTMGLLDTVALGVVLAAGTMAHPEFATVSASIFGLVTVLIAWIFLHEPISRIQWIGVLVVFGAIAWLASTG